MTVRAVQFDRYGKADVVRLGEVPESSPGNSQVKVRVEAVSINAVDLAVRSGRFRYLTLAKPPLGLGIDFVGTVEELGADSDRLAVGDRVWGVRARSLTYTVGTLAERVVVPVTDVAQVPVHVPAVELISALAPAAVAWTAVDRHAQVDGGDRVLVRGAAGGMGAAIAQLAVHRGAEVIGVAGAGARQPLQGIGVSDILDYRDVSVSQVPELDVLIDTVGTELLAWRDRVRPGGGC